MSTEEYFAVHLERSYVPPPDYFCVSLSCTLVLSPSGALVYTQYVRMNTCVCVSVNMCTHVPAELVKFPFMASSMQGSKCTQCRVGVGPLHVVKFPMHTVKVVYTYSRRAYIVTTPALGILYTSPGTHVWVHMTTSAILGTHTP